MQHSLHNVCKPGTSDMQVYQKGASHADVHKPDTSAHNISKSNTSSVDVCKTDTSRNRTLVLTLAIWGPTVSILGWLFIALFWSWPSSPGEHGNAARRREWASPLELSPAFGLFASPAEPECKSCVATGFDQLVSMVLAFGYAKLKDLPSLRYAV